MTEAGAKHGGITWPPVIYLAAIAAGGGLGFAFPLPWIGDLLGEVLFAIGWLLVLATAALWFAAIRAMMRAKTTLNPAGVPDHLLTGGPFSVTRNPIYLANTLLVIGIGLVLGNAWLLLCALAAAFLTQKLVIEREERTLATKFGKKYRDYAQKVRRWI